MSKCKAGYYYCYTDKKCKPISKGLRVTSKYFGNGKEPEEVGIDKPLEGNGNGNGNGNGEGVSESWSKKYKESINCDDPKGFSQRAHCQGRKKKMNEEKKDHEYSMARSEVKTIQNAAKRLQKKMGKKGEGNLQAWVQSKITKAADYIDTAADYVTNEETVKEEGLRDWFGKSKSKDGKKGWVNVVTGDSCASDKPGEGIPKCVSSAKRASMSKKERLAAAAAKRREDPGQQEKSGASKPTMVKTDRKVRKEEMEVNEAKDKQGKGSGKKDACYNKVKSRYSVWPSAYASGALVKCRKVGADNWGNKSESYDFSNWRDDFKALEIESIDLIKPDPLVKKESFDIDPKKHREQQRAKKIRDRTKTDDEGSEIAKKKVKGPALFGEGKNDPCWVGYKQVGMKKKGNKMVPNCVKEGEEINEIHSQAHTPHEVPSGDVKKLVKKAVKRIDTDADGDVDNNDKAKGELGEFIPGVGNKRLYSMTRPKTAKENFSNWREDLGEDWQKVNKGDKTDGMSQKAVDAYRRENPGSKLKTAVTEKDPGPGRSKRRKSFCARSKGQQDMHNIDCSKDPDKSICKARRRWRC